MPYLSTGQSPPSDCINSSSTLSRLSTKPEQKPWMYFWITGVRYASAQAKKCTTSHAQQLANNSNNKKQNFKQFICKICSAHSRVNCKYVSQVIKNLYLSELLQEKSRNFRYLSNKSYNNYKSHKNAVKRVLVKPRGTALIIGITELESEICRKFNFCATWSTAFSCAG